MAKGAAAAAGFAAYLLLGRKIVIGIAAAEVELLGAKREVRGLDERARMLEAEILAVWSGDVEVRG